MSAFITARVRYAEGKPVMETGMPASWGKLGPPAYDPAADRIPRYSPRGRVEPESV